MQQHEIIGKINVVEVDVSCIAGTVSKDESGSTAFTGGAVRYIDPAHLRVFTTQRAAGHRVCRAVGTRFLGGWAIADEQLPGVLQQLEEVNARIAMSREILVRDFAHLKREWEIAHPEVAPYSNRFPDSAWVASRVGMKVGVYKILPQEVGEKIDDAVVSAVTGMSATALQEIAQDIKDCWNPDAGRSTGRIHNLLGRIINKLRALQYIGGHLGDIARLVEETADRLPKKGTIEGHDYQVLSTLLVMLQDPDMTVRVATQRQAFNDVLAADEKEGARQESLASVMGEPATAVQTSLADDFEAWARENLDGSISESSNKGYGNPESSPEDDIFGFMESGAKGTSPSDSNTENFSDTVVQDDTPASDEAHYAPAAATQRSSAAFEWPDDVFTT